jgi:hypothetical protein
MSRPTSIRLDDESKKLVEGIGNLSHYVRTVIKDDPRLRRIVKEEHHPGYPHPNVTFCHPFGGRHLCLICWPDGAPSKDKWGIWSKDQMMHTIRNRPGIHSARPLGEGIEENTHVARSTEPPENEGQKAVSDDLGLIRRFIRWVF